MGAKLTIQEIKSLVERFPGSTISNMATEILEFRSVQQRLYIVTKPTEQNPHAELIAQCDRDRVDYPEFWWELWKVELRNGWEAVSKEWVEFGIGMKYRQHPHRESIIKFHGCSDADKLRWQCKGKNMEWENMNKPPVNWFDDVEYRLRPRTCQLTLQNGEPLEYPEPCREPLENGQEYWAIMLACGSIVRSKWDNCNLDKNRLKNNVIHLTEQAAQQHLEVLQAVNAQVAL